MLSRIASFTVRRRKLVLAAAIVSFALAGMIGGGVASELTSGGFDDPNAESVRAEDALLEEFGTGTPNLILLVTAENGGRVDDPAVADLGTALTAQLAGEEGVADVVSYWSAGSAPPLASTDGDRALVLARVEGDDDVVSERVEELSPLYTRDGPVASVAVGGFAEVFRQVGETVESDLVRAESIALPVTLVLLVIVFGSLVAASLPLAIGALSVVGTFLVLWLLSQVTEVSIYALNLTTALGLGLAIDYSLFIVSRYREELGAGHEPFTAVIRTVRTAGRTVAFSALTVAASLGALLVFPLAFLRSFAYAGIAVAALAGVYAVVVLPALLAVLGRNVDRGRLWRRAPRPPEEGFWHRVATRVMRRPIPVATVVIALLLVLGSPVLGLELGLPDDRVLPDDTSSRDVSDVIRDEFASEDAGAISVVAIGSGDPAAASEEIDGYAARLASLDGVSRVDAFTGTYCGPGLATQLGCEPGQLVLPSDGGPQYARFATDDSTFLNVVPSIEPLSAEGEALVKEVRAAEAPFEVLVSGQPASLVDGKDSLFDALPLAVGIIAVVTFVLLFLMFGSVVVPLKALALNVLSLSATFGAMVWIFQDGHLSGTLDFTATGTIATVMPVLMFCIAFGLSMDYEVFLLSRIKEEYDRTHDNARSVALGLERTGRIVTAAAVLISVVFIAFATSGVSFIKLFGIGLTLAVLLDAFVIRGTLVPAFMALAGEANWWAPSFLRRLHERIGVSEVVDLDEERTAAGLDLEELEPEEAAAPV